MPKRDPAAPPSSVSVDARFYSPVRTSSVARAATSPPVTFPLERPNNASQSDSLHHRERAPHQLMPPLLLVPRHHRGSPCPQAHTARRAAPGRRRDRRRRRRAPVRRPRRSPPLAEPPPPRRSAVPLGPGPDAAAAPPRRFNPTPFEPSRPRCRLTNADRRRRTAAASCFATAKSPPPTASPPPRRRHAKKP
ncbi:serine/arginine repetitive matrix protein 1-like [Eucalyptus grandis]|uniref:serine/arginine repetitive matrix protein 1-like n=1 Tax=Eucalyptus grandis TaxID=71139 RepID=UPI00192E87E5|nr:serine/arginine repetitive matrix protein 1-like [Eucalyptus grandis]